MLWSRESLLPAITLLMAAGAGVVLLGTLPLPLVHTHKTAGAGQHFGGEVLNTTCSPADVLCCWGRCAGADRPRKYQETAVAAAVTTPCCRYFCHGCWKIKSSPRRRWGWRWPAGLRCGGTKPHSACPAARKLSLSYCGGALIGG